MVIILIPSMVSAYSLVICAVFQNEDFFLEEWIEYHKMLGVEHFYLYNNLSEDRSVTILEPYIRNGEVELFTISKKTTNQKEYLDFVQLPAYNHALNLIREKTQWAAFIDLDEFIVPVKYDTLLPLLDEYKSFGGLAVNWQIYGTSWIDAFPEEKLIIESLLWKGLKNCELNKTVKMIVQPKQVEKIENPHNFCFKKNFFAISSNKIPLQKGHQTQPVIINTIRINHYWFGCRNWFITNKIPRRSKWGIILNEEILEEIFNPFNQVKDTVMLRFVETLKKRMKYEEAINRFAFDECPPILP